MAKLMNHKIDEGANFGRQQAVTYIDQVYRRATGRVGIAFKNFLERFVFDVSFNHPCRHTNQTNAAQRGVAQGIGIVRCEVSGHPYCVPPIGAGKRPLVEKRAWFEGGAVVFTQLVGVPGWLCSGEVGRAADNDSWTRGQAPRDKV